MCGIIGHIGERETEKVLHEGLKRLDYRGYDSWGVATEEGIEKETGHIPEDIEIEGDIGIGHTRWATHGGVTKENAHPHESCEGNTTCTCGDLCGLPEDHNQPRFAIVHNGILENHEFIKEELSEEHEYSSETDSEVLAHWMEESVSEDGLEPRLALKQFQEVAEGSYAVVVIDREEGKLYALKNKSPLLLAPDNEKEGFFLASDVYAVSKWSEEAIFLEDGEICEVVEGGVIFKELSESRFDEENPEKRVPQPQEFEWTEEDPELGSYDHWMEKEISQSLYYLEQMLDEQNVSEIAEKIEDSERVIFAASGTSYHASLLGVYYLQKAGIEAQALIASEFQNYERVNENTTLIAVSQSGETRDVLDAIEYSREKGADVVSITNVPYSTIERKSDINVSIHAEQEICVAATKTFINQLGTMMNISEELGADTSTDGLVEAVRNKSDRVKRKAMEDAGKLKDEDDIYVLGSGTTYPIAREIALKLKEISYKHAEGMMAGELKHGTLALVEEGTPVIALDDYNMESSIEEVKSRGAEVFRLDRSKYTRRQFQICSVLYGFWLTYYLAKYNDLPIDKPRNLAKSVTVK